MHTLVLANQKGGVGKTAVATLLVHQLARSGHRVLALDFDHQGNFSKPLRLSGRPAVAAVTADTLMTGPPPAVPLRPFVLVPSDRALLGLERQPALHTPFARNLRAFLTGVDRQFDVCVIDTNPNPDIRVIAALASADFVLSPIQLNQEALDGVGALLNHDRVGLRKIRAVLNPRLHLIGLLPTLVEPTPFQKANFVQLVQQYRPLLIPLAPKEGEGGGGGFAHLPRRSSIAEAQAHGEVLWEVKKTAARDAWREIEPGIDRIATLVTAQEPVHATAAG
jgi:chromosome partitioning protein